jgi:hypothetical protein
MKGISSQFYGKIEVAKWVTNSLKIIPSLINKNVPEKYSEEIIQPEMWVIGPKEKSPKNVFLYGQNGYSFEKKITSINPQNNSNTLMVECENFYWYKLIPGKAASVIAKTLEMLINGYYTDVALIGSTSIYDIIDEIRA